MWSNTEQALGITCGCLPILPRFIKHVWNASSIGDSEAMVQMRNGKTGATISQKSKASKKDWVELKETTKPRTPQQAHAPFDNSVPTYREELVPSHKDDLETGIRD